MIEGGINEFNFDGSYRTINVLTQIEMNIALEFNVSVSIAINEISIALENKEVYNAIKKVISKRRDGI